MDQLLTLMPRSGKYGRFNATAAFSVAAALLALLAPNLLISVSAYVHGPISYRAAAWQSHDHGVVGLPVTSEAEFKHLRLKQKSSDLRTLVLGSSRIMGLDSGVLGSKSYNLSLSSNSAAVALAQAQIVLEFLPNLQTIYFSVDWAIGDIFYPYPIPSLAFTKTPPLNLDQIVKLVRESISMRRLSMLLGVFWDDP